MKCLWWKKSEKKNIDELKKELHVDYHTVDINVLCNRFNTDIEKGLTTAQAKEGNRTYGLNELTPPPTVSEWVKFLKTLVGGFSILLWCGSALCMFAYIVEVATTTEDVSQDNLFLGFVLAAVVLITGVFSYYQERKSSKIMESFALMVPHFAHVVRDGAKATIKSEKLTLGDIVDVSLGDRIPADIRIIESKRLKVDNSSLTGESAPQLRQVKMTNENPLETQNLAFFSTNAVEGSARGIVVAIGDATVMGRIAGLASGLKVNETPISKEMNRFVKIITMVACSIGVSMCSIAFIMGYPWIDAIVFLIGLIVANVPEGLTVTVAVALSLTAKRMASKNCLIKNLEAVETLGSTSVICSDKTGTLTQNRMTVSHLWFDNQVHEADTTEDQSGPVEYQKSKGWRSIERCAALCSRAEFSAGQKDVPIQKRQVVGDGSETALLKCVALSLDDVEGYRQRFPKVAEIPFNSTSKFQVSVHPREDNKGYFLVMKGAPEGILSRCTSILINGETLQLTEEWKKNFDEEYEYLGGLGERVLGFCDHELPPSQYPPGTYFIQIARTNMTAFAT